MLVSPPPHTASSSHHHRYPQFRFHPLRSKASTFTNLPTSPANSFTLRSDPVHTFSLLQQIQSLCQSEEAGTALGLIQNGSVLNSEQKAQAISVLIQFCSRAKDIEACRALDSIVSDEFGNDLVLNTRLITMYSLCGFPSDARNLFDRLKNKDLVQWNAVISAYTKNECWTDAMLMFSDLVRDDEFYPDKFTLPCVIKACCGFRDWRFGEGVHGMGVKMGLVFDVFVGNALIAMYGKMGMIESAVKVFESMSEMNLVSWNSLISAFSENSYLTDALMMFKNLMEESCLVPDVASLVSIFPVCARESEVQFGTEVHALAVKLGLSSDLMVNNAITDMYSKCGLLNEAMILFDNNLDKNVVCWNTMIGGYAKSGDAIAALNILRKMQTEGYNVQPDEVTILNALSVCTQHIGFSSVKELHGYSLRHSFRFRNDDKVVNALVTAYSKCGCTSYAEKVFNGVEMKNVSAWNSVIAGFAQNGDSDKALSLFHRMRMLGKIEPDRFTIGSMLLALSSNGKNCLNGKEIHGYVLRNGLDSEHFISVSLMSFYVSCSDVVAARCLFDQIVEKCEVSWNAMLAGYMQNELPFETINLFREMAFGCVRPSEISLTSVLGACSELSVLRLGKEVHCAAIRSQLIEDAYVSCSVMDMYAKCGCIRQSQILFDRLEVKDLASWNVLITGYGIHGQGSEAMRYFEEMRRSNVSPDGVTYLGVIMACGHSGLVEQGLKYFNQMEASAKLEHYACVVDMLSRAGRFEEALELIQKMPMEPDVGILSSVLSMCRRYGRMDLGDKIGKELIKLKPEKAENYVLVSNLYAQYEKWDEVERMRKTMKELRLEKEPGCSWIEVGGKVYSFIAGDKQQFEECDEM